jgi:hypothetical protein
LRSSLTHNEVRVAAVFADAFVWTSGIGDDQFVLP